MSDASASGPMPPPPPPVQQAGDATGGLIPYKNAPALTSYYLGIFSFICVIGVVLGIFAVALGIKGLRNAKRNPQVKGVVHAWVGIICGCIFGLFNTILTVGLIAARLSK